MDLLVAVLAIGGCACVRSAPGSPVAEAPRAPETPLRPAVAVTRPSPVPLGPWECGFPKGVDQNQFTVYVDIAVDATGVAESAVVPGDPWGFGDLAWDCAMSHRYLPATDADGKAVRGTLGEAIGFARMPSVGEMVRAIDEAKHWFGPGLLNTLD
jgi:hypothetical protein